MAMKPKTSVGTPSTYSRVRNTAGWGRSNLGGDTMPGPGIGAPLVNNRRSDDSGVKTTYYADGIGPGAMTPHAPTPGVLDGRASGPQTHPDLMTKVDNEAVAEHEIGNTPRGTIAR